MVRTTLLLPAASGRRPESRPWTDTTTVRRCPQRVKEPVDTFFRSARVSARGRQRHRTSAVSNFAVRPLLADCCRSYTNLSRCFQTSPVRSLSVTTNEPSIPTLRNLTPALPQPVRRQHGGIARAQAIMHSAVDGPR